MSAVSDIVRGAINKKDSILTAFQGWTLALPLLRNNTSPHVHTHDSDELYSLKELLNQFPLKEEKLGGLPLPSQQSLKEEFVIGSGCP